MPAKDITIPMRCTSCGHVQQVNGVEQEDGTRFLGSGANWCDRCQRGKPEPIDPESDTARLAHHRALHRTVHPDIAAAARAQQEALCLLAHQRNEAAAHLHALLNQRRTATQMLDAERAARDWLVSIGSEPT